MPVGTVISRRGAGRAEAVDRRAGRLLPPARFRRGSRALVGGSATWTRAWIRFDADRNDDLHRYFWLGL